MYVLISQNDTYYVRTEITVSADQCRQCVRKAPHLVKQNASLQIYRKHVAALRGGKLALLSSDALRKDILSLIPKGK